MSGNTAVTDGGGLSNNITATLKSVTPAGNGANRGGGIFSPGDLTIGNTTWRTARRVAIATFRSARQSLGANLDSANTCGFGAGDQINKNPLPHPAAGQRWTDMTHAIFSRQPGDRREA
jgi:hypothetical protein